MWKRKRLSVFGVLTTRPGPEIVFVQFLPPPCWHIFLRIQKMFFLILLCFAFVWVKVWHNLLSSQDMEVPKWRYKIVNSCTNVLRWECKLEFWVAADHCSQLAVCLRTLGSVVPFPGRAPLDFLRGKMQKWVPSVPANAALDVQTCCEQNHCATSYCPPATTSQRLPATQTAQCHTQHVSAAFAEFRF